ncbi:thioredoxin domain-containing protein [Escherichia coli]|nr:thioredoxin domain-containing protein [Escherichia coli]
MALKACGMTRRRFVGLCMVLNVMAPGLALGDAVKTMVVPQLVQAAEQPAVVEFFSFYCPPCFAFYQQYGIDKGIRDVLPSGKKMVKYHVDFLGPLGPQLTDAWAMAQVMGIEDKVEPLLFEATQVTRSLTTPDSIRAVFEKAGVSGEEYDRMMDSILVKARAAEMRQRFRDYKVTGTPAVFVNGQHINNSDFRGETPEAYRQEYVDAVEKLLKAGG